MGLRHLLEAGFWVFGGAFAVLHLYAAGGILFPFLLATRKLRVRVATRAVVLTGIDPGAMAVSAFGIGIFPAIFAPFGGWGAGLGTLLGLLACLGARLRVHITPVGTTVVRTVLFVVPWSWRSYASPPSAFVDGWGDFSDPLSLQVALDGDALELGWGGKVTPSCEALADRINAAIAAL